MLGQAGFHCIALPFERSLRHPLRDLRAVFGLWSAVRRERPNIVHLVSLKPILLSCLALTIHRRTHFVAAFTGLGYVFSSRDRRARWFQRLVVALLRIVLRRPNVWIIVQNTDDRALLEAAGLGDPERTVLIAGAGGRRGSLCVRRRNDHRSPAGDLAGKAHLGQGDRGICRRRADRQTDQSSDAHGPRRGRRPR